LPRFWVFAILKKKKTLVLDWCLVLQKKKNYTKLKQLSFKEIKLKLNKYKN
jgi:hypothetical protein